MFRERCVCIHTNFDKLIPFFEFSSKFHRVIRTTNVIERSFEEVRRRLKVMGYFQNTKSCKRIVLSLFFYFNTKRERKTERIIPIAQYFSTCGELLGDSEERRTRTIQSKKTSASLKNYWEGTSSVSLINLHTNSNITKFPKKNLAFFFFWLYYIDGKGAFEKPLTINWWRLPPNVERTRWPLWVAKAKCRRRLWKPFSVECPESFFQTAYPFLTVPRPRRGIFFASIFRVRNFTNPVPWGLPLFGICYKIQFPSMVGLFPRSNLLCQGIGFDRMS